MWSSSRRTVNGRSGAADVLPALLQRLRCGPSACPPATRHGPGGNILSFVPLFKDVFLHVFYWEVPWALFPPLGVPRRCRMNPLSPPCSPFVLGPRRPQHRCGRCQPSGLINPEFVHNVYCFNQLRHPCFARALASLMPTHQDSLLCPSSLSLFPGTSSSPRCQDQVLGFSLAPLDCSLLRRQRHPPHGFLDSVPVVFSTPTPCAVNWIPDGPLPARPRLALLPSSPPLSCLLPLPGSRGTSWLFPSQILSLLSVNLSPVLWPMEIAFCLLASSSSVL